MTKTLCDICGKESKVEKFNYPCHLDPSGKWNMYVDSEMNPVSGRHEYKDCCSICYNVIYYAAITKMVELMKSGSCK